MTRRRVPIAVAAILATTTIGGAARADDEAPLRVLVAGPKKDPIAARLEKEIIALGFEPVSAGPLNNCKRAALVAAVAEAGASAALCSDGDSVGVWTPEGDDLKLRDVVAPEEKGPHGREHVAMRAAEIMRASVALRDEAEPEAEPAPPPKTSALVLGGWDDFENPDKVTPPPLPDRTPRLTASAGASILASSDAKATGMSIHASVGVHRAVALTLHVDAPINGAVVEPGIASTTPQSRLGNTGELRVTPGIAGVGVEMPLQGPRARFIPRVGVALGVAWLHASRTGGSTLVSGVTLTNGDASATVASPAGWATASLSVGIVGPLRGVVEGLVGTAAGRLTVRDQGELRAHWGVPMAALALRAEVLLP